MIWMGLMLFPVAWLARQTHVTGYWFTLLTPEWVHILAHTFIFASLAVMVLSLFRSNHILLYAGVLLLALVLGVLQESIQLIAAGMRPGRDELFDLVVDLLGALGGMSFVAVRRMLAAVMWPLDQRVAHSRGR